MKSLIVTLILVLFLSAAAFTQKPGSRFEAKTSVAWAKQVNQGFSMRIWLSNQMAMGLQAWDLGSLPLPTGPQGGLIYPAESDIEHLYGAGPWIGGIVNGARRVSEGYNGDNANKYILPNRFHPLRERIWFTSTRSVNEPNVRDFDDDGDGRIDEDDLDGTDNDGDWSLALDDVGADGLADRFESGCNGAYDEVTNPDPAFDNYDSARVDSCHPDGSGNFRRSNDKDLYTEKNGLQDHGEPHVDEDYAAVSESDYYLSATDTVAIPGHTPMGVKFIQKSYAWSSSVGEALLPFDYAVVNIGANVIRDAYFSFFVDADLGPTAVQNYYQHNYSCYFDSLRTAFVHNPVDRGSTPLGLAFLSAPRPFDELKFIYRWFDFASQTPGTIDSMLYVWMSGAWFPEQLVAPCQSANNASDNRFFLSMGPFDEFKPGDTLRFSVAFVSGFGVDHGPGNMKQNVERAIVMRNRGYHVPSAPPSPELRTTSEQMRVTLDWSATTSSVNPLQYVDLYDPTLQALPDTHWRRRDHPDPQHRGARSFEGFKVWRSESALFDTSSFVQIAQYDVDDDMDFGAQTGLRYSFVDSTVAPGSVYWYAVTSYSIPGIWGIKVPGSPESYKVEAPSLESQLRENATRVTVGFTAAGSRNEVLVVPNPYRADNRYEGSSGVPMFDDAFRGDNGKIWFIHLPSVATIRIFSLVGEEIATIEHDDAKRASSGLFTGQEEWTILSGSGLPLTSGIYVFTVESELGTQIGKFVILR